VVDAAAPTANGGMDKQEHGERLRRQGWLIVFESKLSQLSRFRYIETTFRLGELIFPLDRSPLKKDSEKQVRKYIKSQKVFSRLCQSNGQKTRKES
jgi:hypothetical protein